MEAVDNIDHNLTATSSISFFHGTGISLFQPFLENDVGVMQDSVTFKSNSSKNIQPLPLVYTNIEPVSVSTAYPAVPIISDPYCDHEKSKENYDLATVEESKWVNKVVDGLQDVDNDNVTNVLWSAYHASGLRDQRYVLNKKQRAMCSLLPLFEHESHSIAMIKHTMATIKSAVHYLNGNQICPVISLCIHLQKGFSDAFHKYLVKTSLFLS